MKRARVGSFYVFQPVPFDRCNPPAGIPDLEPGSIVKVVNLHGCPPANTMGSCYVEHLGRFAGMVLTASLEPIRKYGIKRKECIG